MRADDASSPSLPEKLPEREKKVPPDIELPEDAEYEEPTTCWFQGAAGPGLDLLDLPVRSDWLDQ